MRCDALQGYLFSKSLDAELFAKRFLIGHSQTDAQGIHTLGRLGQA
jgi:EAL domain-containing protein (putative c-di-GMP-specific phosphodiesterase class I)